MDPSIIMLMLIRKLLGLLNLKLRVVAQRSPRGIWCFLITSDVVSECLYYQFSHRGSVIDFFVKDKGADWCKFPPPKDYNVLSQLKMVVRVFALLHMHISCKY